MPEANARVYEPDRAYYGPNYESLLDAPDVARALDLLGRYCSDEARADFAPVRKARAARDAGTAERLLSDWCRKHARPEGRDADALRGLREAALRAKGAALDADELAAIDDDFRQGVRTGSYPEAVSAAEAAKLRGLRDGLKTAIGFQAEVSEAVSDAPWVTMTEDELDAFLDEWDRTRRREKALEEIRAARGDQKSFIGRVEWSARYPEVFGS